MNEVASFHLATFPRRRLVSRLISVPAERWEMTQVDGCLLGKVMGTSKSSSTRISANLARWAIIAFWRDEMARQRFIDESSVMKRWRKTASTLEHYLLEPIEARGSWDGLSFPSPGRDGDAQVAVLTRAAVRPAKWLTFARSVGRVDDALAQSEGCDLALGMGEWPVGEQATFSIWQSADAINEFAYKDEAHKQVIRRTFDESWYSEMLFARFSVKR